LTSLRLDLSAAYEDHTGTIEAAQDYDRLYYNVRGSIYRKFSEVLTGFASLSWRRDDNDSNEKDDIRLEAGFSVKL
jgi:hypothetical protein